MKRRTHYEIIDDGIKIKKIRLYYYDEDYDEELPEDIDYPIITMDEIKKQWEKDGCICLDRKYIKDFSVSKLDDDVFISHFSAAETFFDGNASFCGANFGNGDVDFTGVNFGNGYVNFNKVTFGDGDVNFSNVNFGDGYVNFNKVTFGDGYVNFSDVNFGNSIVDFVKAKFGDNYVDFSHTNFGDVNVDFVGATFDNSDVDFKNSKFSNGTLFFYNSFNKTLDLRIDCADKIIFDNCANYNIIDMNNEPKKINILSFVNMKNFGHIELNWDTYKDALYQTIENKPDHRINQYKMLKQNFNIIGEYDREDESYVAYRRLATEQIKDYPLKKGFYKLLEILGDYGTNPLKVFIWMFVVVFVCGLLFSIDFSAIYGGTKELSELPSWAGFYYSLITFLTVGYGDYSAQTDWAALLAGFEGFCGVFLMSFFSVSLVRKILR